MEVCVCVCVCVCASMCILVKELWGENSIEEYLFVCVCVYVFLFFLNSQCKDRPLTAAVFWPHFFHSWCLCLFRIPGC